MPVNSEIVVDLKNIESPAMCSLVENVNCNMYPIPLLILEQ